MFGDREAFFFAFRIQMHFPHKKMISVAEEAEFLFLNARMCTNPFGLFILIFLIVDR